MDPREKVYFVTGIDTDAGKSYATGWLARRWSLAGERVVTQKLIQTGCPPDAASEDIALHRRIMGCGLLPCDRDGTTCPIRLPYPASPDLAARLAGVEIDLRLADAATERLLSEFDRVLLEGAGGLLVPIRGGYTMADYAAERGYPLIVVTNPRLGSVNHTLLTLEACRARGLRVAAVAYNLFSETSPGITADTRRYLAGYLAAHDPACEFVEIPVLPDDFFA